MSDDPMERWKLAGLIASVVIVLSIPVYVIKESRSQATRRPGDDVATFLGRDNCVECHEDATEAWRGSDHDWAMTVASDSTVLGDFDDVEFNDGRTSARFHTRDGRYLVQTEGPDGEPGEFEIAYTFGFEPLQQYLIPFPGGRLQSLTIAWDTERRAWFSLYSDEEIPPDDWLHWTRGGQTWNSMCAECHSTDLVKGYDATTKTFSTTWSEIDVSCEACHGPGSSHVEWAELPPMARPPSDDYELVVSTSDISSTEEVELCAPCHSRRRELADYEHNGVELMQFHVPYLLWEGLYHPDGQILEEVYVYGSFLQSQMFQKGVRCTDCHDAHSLQLVKDGNDLCLQCHQADQYDTYDHHFHQREFEGEPSAGHLCVSCHMPQWPFMEIDYRADHSMTIPRPDLSLVIETPNACSMGGCHDDRTVEWAADYFRQWYGRSTKPHFATTFAAARGGAPEAESELIRISADTLYPSIVRATAMSLLVPYEGEASHAALKRGLQDENALVRLTACEAVAPATREESLQLLVPLLFDPVKAIRLSAASRLAGTPRGLLRDYEWEQLEETLGEFRRAMERSLDLPFAGNNLGNLYTSLQQPDPAEAYYRTAIQIDDLFFPAKMNLAVLLNSIGRNEEAEELLREVVEDDPANEEANAMLGLLLVEMGRSEEALEIADRMIAEHPENPIGRQIRDLIEAERSP